MEYEPLDLTSQCNLPASWLEKNARITRMNWTPLPGDVPVGECAFRGIPFRLGTSGSPHHLLGFGKDGYDGPVEIRVGKAFHWIIFAHLLLESRVHVDEPVGRRIANYHLRFIDGEEKVIPIRERFEINIIPDRWGELPFLAVPDNFDCLMPEKEGRWEEFGARLQETTYTVPKWFFLWGWQNPHPENILESLFIEPDDRLFVVGAITLSHVDEHPFINLPGRPLIFRGKGGSKDGTPLDLKIKVDRGMASYSHLLPDSTEDEFLRDPLAGWGQPYDNSSRQAYLEIAAAPSASLKMTWDKNEETQVCWNELLEEGTVEVRNARVELVGDQKNWVHVTVVDDETGKPIPCRIHFRSPEGIPYQPHGHHNHLIGDKGNFNMDVGGDLCLGHAIYAYIHGKCQGWLPSGEVLVDIARGYEYQPLRQSINIQSGQRELTLRLKRRSDMKREGWYSGDTHVHFLSSQGTLLEAQCEDLNVVNLLQSQWGHHFTSTEEFIGKPIASEDGGTIVYTSQENRQHILGHLSLLGLSEAVYPWCSGGADEAEIAGSLDTTLSHWADACHKQGGTVVIPHFPHPNGEIAALIATNRADAVEMVWHDMFAHDEYYRYLNAGYKLPLVGGTDKMSSAVPVGIYRTYVQIPSGEEFNYSNWCKYLRQGWTFLTSGPILSLSVNGTNIGDTIFMNQKKGTLEVHARGSSIFPMHTLQIIQEGKVVASCEDAKGACELNLKAHLKIEHNSWLAARVSGPGYSQPMKHRDEWQRGVMAHTSPIYVSLDQQWNMFDLDNIQYMLTMVNGGIEHIHDHARHYPPHTVSHHHHEADHMAYLKRPFQEALSKLNQRVREQK